MKSKPIPSVADLLIIKDASCPKLGVHATGQLHYRVSRAADGSEVYIAITGNDSAGYYSKESIPSARIEASLAATAKVAKTFPAIRLKGAFEGKSANNASFLVAVLRNEGILGKSPDHEHQHVVSGDIREWRKQMLILPATAPEPQAPPAEAAPADTKPAAEKGKRKAKGKDVAPEAVHTDAETAPAAGSPEPEPLNTPEAEYADGEKPD
jgi:hypothetical protein